MENARPPRRRVGPSGSDRGGGEGKKVEREATRRQIEYALFEINRPKITEASLEPSTKWIITRALNYHAHEAKTGHH